MLYTDADLILYLFFYSFLGWIAEVTVFSLRTHRFVNRGILNMPLCLSYGVIMNLLILMTGARQSNAGTQFAVCFILTSVVCFLAGFISERILRNPVFDYQTVSGFGGTLIGLLYSLAASAVFFMAWKIIHPLVFTFVSLLPIDLVRILALILGIILLLDILSVFTVRIFHRNLSGSARIRAERKASFGEAVAANIWRRLTKAYPLLTDSSVNVEEADEEIVRSGIVFAEGMCLNKVIWVFLITALLGDIIETFYCRIVGGTWMRRSSLVYGPFSLVWGIGAALLTIILYKLITRSDRFIFIGGFFLGGAFEYFSSVFLEAVFGMKFWDYSNMPLNFDGRTNVLFMFFWGLLALIWLKLLYPPLSRFIEKIPPVSGMVVTWALMVLMCCDILVTSAVMLRTTQRRIKPGPSNIIEQFIDDNYPDETIKEMWPNMSFLEDN